MRPYPAPRLSPDLTPEERFRELASLLALGLRALRDLALSAPGQAPAPSPDSDRNCLEVSGETRLSVHTG